MGIKDKVYNWFIRRVIKSKMENIDNPGFISAKIGPGSSGKTVRKLYLPEELMAEIENNISDELGEEGVKALYRAGKRKGNRFMYISDFPRHGEVSDNNLMRFFRFFSNYVEIVYSSGIESEIDLEEHTFRAELEDFLVCRQNGKGHVLTSGTPAGALAYMFDNPEIEAAKPECVGRGDEKCVIEVAEPEKLEDEPVATSSDVRNENLDSDYDMMNKPREAEYSNTSLGSFDEEDVEYNGSEGVLDVNGQLHLIVEVCMTYFLEQELEEKGGEILFETSRENGRQLAEGKDKEFVKKYLSSLGWGDVQLEEDRVEINYFPWMPQQSEVEFTIFRGLLSGMMSEILGKEVVYSQYETSIDEGMKLVLLNEG